MTRRKGRGKHEKEEGGNDMTMGGMRSDKEEGESMSGTQKMMRSSTT